MEDTQYISLANKYRPQTFEDMVGQESISKTLQNAIKTGRIGHAYLFYGPRGCGKTTTARILAKALNCTGNGNTAPTPHPCGTCPACQEIAQSKDFDVLELDAASNTGVDNVRQAIIDTASLAAGRDRFKVFILDEVHMLSNSAFNALLKTIEEPPAHVIFILATTEKHKVPATIVSRCQTFRFRPLSLEEISSHLLELAEAENIDLTSSAAKIIAKNAGGAMRDALTLLDRVIAFAGTRVDEKLVADMLGLTPQELIKQTVNAFIQKDNVQLHQVFETLQQEGFDANGFLKDLKNAIGDLFYFSLGQGSEPFDGAKALTAQTSAGFLAQLSRKINKLIEEVKFSDNAFISAEVGLFTIMDSVLDIDGFIRRLEALEQGVALPPQGPARMQPTASVKTTSRPAVTLPETKTVTKAVETKPIAKKAFVKTEEPVVNKAEEKPAPIKELDETISNRQVWDKMLEKFAKIPFTYDIMITGRIAFTSADQWTLSFPAGKEFYQITAKDKLGELSQSASQISGRTIRIVLADQPAQPVVKPSVQTVADAPIKLDKQTSKQATPKLDISAEEPFSVGPFEEGKVVAFEDAPEEVQDILKILPGELLA